MTNDDASGEFEEFEVIPAVDIQDGEVVQLVQGNAARRRPTAIPSGSPAVDRRRRKDAAPRRPRRRVRGRAAECGRYRRRDRRRRRSDPVGRRDPHRRGAIGLLERGVDRVILGTAAVENPDIVAEISESYPDSVVVSLDAKDGEVVVEGWTEGAGISPVEAAQRYDDLGAAAILFTNVDVEGQLEGVATDPVRELVDATDIPVIASGGVTRRSRTSERSKGPVRRRSSSAARCTRGTSRSQKRGLRSMSRSSPSIRTGRLE